MGKDFGEKLVFELCATDGLLQMLESAAAAGPLCCQFSLDYAPVILFVPLIPSAPLMHKHQRCRAAQFRARAQPGRGLGDARRALPADQARSSRRQGSPAALIPAAPVATTSVSRYLSRLNTHTDWTLLLVRLTSRILWSSLWCSSDWSLAQGSHTGAPAPTWPHAHVCNDPYCCMVEQKA